MKIILIRHFMTQGNLEHRYIGTTDEPLLPGQAISYDYPEAEAVAVSTLKRCVETAEIIYPGTRSYVCEELRECDFGLFENQSYEQLKDHPAYQEWLRSGGRVPFPGGEGMDEFCDRCVKGFCRMTEKFMEESMEAAAFVVHGGTIMAILDRLAGHEEGFYHWQVKNGEAYRACLCEKEWRSGIRRLTEIEKL